MPQFRLPFRNIKRVAFEFIKPVMGGTASLNPLVSAQRSAVRFPRLRTIILAIGLVLGAGGSEAHGAETVILKYRDIRESVQYEDFQEFAETGTLSEDLSRFFAEAQLSPDAFQAILTDEIPGVRLRPIDLEFVALQVARTLGEPLERDSREAVEEALLQSYEGDRTLTILELVRNYPASEVRLDFARLAGLGQDVDLYINQVATILRVVEQLLPELVCDCGLNDDEWEGAFAQHRQSPIALSEHDSAAIGPSTAPSTAPCQAHHADARQAFLIAQANLLPDDEPPLLDPPSPPQSPPLESTSPPPVREIPINRISRRVIIDIGPVKPSFSMEGLNAFAETGVLSPGWAFYLNIAGLDRVELRNLLTKQAAVDASFLDQNLNNLLGEYILFQISQVVHTPSGRADIQALRSALMLSALDDQRISLLEVLQNYPAETIVIEGINLARLASNIERDGAVRTVTSDLEGLLLEFQSSVAETVCECDEEATVDGTSSDSSDS